MTTMDLDPETDDAAPPRGPKLWLAWSIAGAGFLALAASLGLSIAQARAEPLGPTPTLPGALEPYAETAASAPFVAVVIDDVGLDVAAARRAIELPAQVTLAFLPYAENAAALDAEARAAGHEVIVHLPMEPLGFADPGPDALETWLSASEVRRRIERAFEHVPGAQGVSNHMGSRFTACATCVEPVVAAAAARGVFVLDSRTTADSQLAAAADAAGADWAARDVFLDNEQSEAAIADALAHAETVARERGYAVAIGHPHPATLSVLERWIPEAEARGVTVAPVSAAVARRAHDAATPEHAGA